MIQPRSEGRKGRSELFLRSTQPPPLMPVWPCRYCGNSVVICDKERRGLISHITIRLMRMHETWPKPYSPERTTMIRRLMSAHTFLRTVQGPVLRNTATEIQAEIWASRWYTGDLPWD